MSGLPSRMPVLVFLNFWAEFLTVFGVWRLLTLSPSESSFTAEDYSYWNWPKCLFFLLPYFLLILGTGGMCKLAYCCWFWLTSSTIPSSSSSPSSSLSLSFSSSSTSPSSNFLFFLPLESLPTFEMRRLLRPLPFFAIQIHI